MKQKIMVIDSFSLLYKAFYGVRPMNAADGTPTNAIYGFINMLLKLVRDYEPTYLFAAFDAGKETFRTEVFADYKAGRQSMPEDLAAQIPIVIDLLKEAGVHFLQCKNYEADDILGHVSKWADKNGYDSILVTGDRDSFQLASEATKILYAKRGVSDTVDVTPAYVRETYDLRPKQLIDVKALMGDKSDNIPGIAGIGEKTALKLIRQYESLDGVYEHLSEQKGKLKERLETGKEDAYLSRELGAIQTEIPITIDLDEGDDYRFDNEDVIATLSKLDMKNIIKQLGATVQKKENETFEFTTLTEHQVPDLQDKTVSVIFSDCSARMPQDVGLFFDGEAILVTQASKEWIRTVFENKSVEKLTHQFKETYKELLKQDIVCRNVTFDTYLAGYVLNPSDERYTLDVLAKKYLDYDMYLHEAKSEQQSFFDTSENGEETRRRLAENASINAKLHALFVEKLHEESMYELYTDIEHKLMFVLAETELEGFRVDFDMLKDLERTYDTQIETLTKQILELAEKTEEFNLNSPKQLGTLLFEELGLPIVKKTKTGYSTDIEVLNRLKNKHPIIPLIIEIRKISKLSSTYIKGFIKITDPVTHKIHTTFNQTVASTGRISSSAPNLQNIPVRTEEGREIRKIFIASSSDHLLIDADYSQIELRILAHITQDENMLRAFRNNEDIHARTASEVFDVPIEDVTRLQRSRAKAVNFGIIYGISDFGLSRNLEIRRGDAKAYIEKYLDRFPGVKQYMEDIVEQARRDGYVSTMFHRRRYIPDIHSANYNQRSFAERTALNTPIQGSAADIIKIAMVRVADRLREGGLDAKLILQIHDELIIDAPKTEEEQVKEILKYEMEHAATLDVPLTADLSSASNWYDAK